jgi:hypothetical protein
MARFFRLHAFPGCSPFSSTQTVSGMHMPAPFTHPWRPFCLALLVSVMCIVAAPPCAQAQMQQNVTIRVAQVNEFAAGEPVTLRINSALPGQSLDAAHAVSHYRVTSNAGGRKGRKITGRLSGNYPEGVTLSAHMEASAGAESTGPQRLGSSPVTLVNGVAKAKGERLQIDYEANVALTVPPGRYTRTVIYTLTRR